ncbi:MAG: nucleoside monophosphate kinase [Candidatus Pacebacteria bacterium]|nr:nucleoside monophosphate kinase [Candidatus Paceibacterota bacterium]
MDTNPLNFVLIGRSGCGKGTQAKLLGEHFGNLYYISTGSLFRKLAQQETEVGYKIKELLEGGGLPFDDLAIMLWMSEISYNLKIGQGFCLDGAPRRLEEAKALDAFLKYLDKQNSTMVILLDISRQEAFERLTKRRICQGCGQLIPWVGDYKNLEICDKCGGVLEERADDVPEAIKHRLDYFDNEVMKVVKYFKKKKRLIKINGEQPIAQVFSDILAEVRKSNDKY